MKLTVLRNPFNTAQREIIDIEYIPGKTIYQYAQPYIMGLDEFVYACNGKVVSTEFTPNAGDYMAVCPVVGKKMGSLLGSLLSIGLSVFTGGIFANGIKFLGIGARSFMSGLIASAVGYLGGQLINHLFPQPSVDMPSYPQSTPTYGWGNLRAQNTQGGILPITYGTMRTAGIEVAKHITTDGEKQYLNILLSGGLGPADSITDIMINDNPIENYKDIVIETRLGVNDQEVIDNFNDTYADQALSYELVLQKSGQEETWVTHQTEGNGVQGLEIALELTNGLYHMNNDGNLENAWVDIEVRYRAIGTNDWVYLKIGELLYKIIVYMYIKAEDGTMRKVKIREEIGVKPANAGNNSGGIFREFKEYIPLDRYNGRINGNKNTAIRKTFRADGLQENQYEVAVRCIGKSGETTRDSTKIYWTQLSGIIYDDFCRPNKILIGIKALATEQLSGSDITVTWKQSVEHVNVFNPNTNQYEQKSARNPAWVCYDILHNCRSLKNIHTGKFEYIVHGGVAAGQIDYQAFESWAKHCDFLELNFEHIFDAASGLWEALKIPESFGRGKVIMKGTRFSCVADKPSIPVQLFTVGNMLENKFSKDYMSLTDRANSIEITFTNRNKGYQKDTITIYDDEWNKADTIKNPTQITLTGCTDYKQAFAHGKYLLRINKMMLRTCSWEAEIDAIACQIGDQVLVSHDVPEWGASGRILAAGATNITLDRKVFMDVGKDYSVIIRLEDDSLITKNVLNTGGENNVITIMEPFKEVPKQYNIFAFGEMKKEAKPFIVIDISRRSELTAAISAIEYVPAVYEECLDVPIIDYAPGVTVYEVEKISVAEETYCQKDGMRVSNINCAWVLPRGAGNKVVLYYSSDGGRTWNYANSSNLNFGVIRDVRTMQNYLVKICTISDLGIISNGVISDDIYITGKDLPPSDVVNLTAKISKTDKTQVNLNWDIVKDIDLKGYRIYVNGEQITQNVINNNQYTYTALFTNTYIFAVVAVDNSGNESKSPATATIYVNVQPSDVTGFTVVTKDTDRSRLLMEWQANPEKDLNFYEIRLSEDIDWDRAKIIATQLKSTRMEYQMSTEGNFSFMIKAVNIQYFYSVNPATVTKQITLRPDAVTNLTTTQNPRDRGEIEITWNPSPGNDIAGYEVSINGVVVAVVKDCRYLWRVLQSGTYEISVIAITVAGYRSNKATITKTVMIEPYDVTSFGGGQSITDRTQVHLAWDEPMTLDVSHYEIRVGESWDNALIIGQHITNIYYDTRVIEERIYTFWIKAISNAGKYSLYPAKFECIFNLNPAPVTNIILSQDENDKSLINIAWTGIKEIDLLYYEIRYGWTWETAKNLVTTMNTNYQFRPDMTTGNVKVMIKSVNKAMYYSTEASAGLYATLEPQAVENFIVQQNGEYVELYWDRAYEHDVTGYEIREGWTFEYGALIATSITGNSHRYKVDFDGIYHYHIKAINRSNKYSIKATDEYIEVVDLPPKNIIQAFDEIETKDGIHNDTEFARSEINWQTIGGKWSDYSSLKFSEVGGLNVLRLLKKADGTYPVAGVYECKQIDVGKVVTANISVKFLSTVKYQGDTSAILQMRVSKDGVKWTIWKDFLPAKFVFRYVETRVNFITSNTAKTAEVNNLKIYIDLPDIEKAGTVTVPIGGMRIDYDKEFYIDPVVTPYAIGAGVHVEVTSRDKKGFHARILNLTGQDIGGVMDWRARGY